MANKTLYDRLDHIIVTVIRFLSYISTVCLAIIMFIAFFNVIGEKLHKAGLTAITGIRMSNEIIQYMHIPLVYLSAAYVTLDQGHTSIDLLTGKFPIAVRRWLQIGGSLMGVAVCGFIGYRALFALMPKHIASFATINSTASGWPVWPFSLMEAIGFFALAVSFLWAVVRILVHRDRLSLASRETEEQEVESDGI